MNNLQSPGKFALNYGLILGCVAVSISVFAYAMKVGLDGEKSFIPSVYYLIFPIVVIYGIYKYKKYNANTLELSDALKIGLVIAIISALVGIIYQIIFHYIIDPDHIKNILDASMAKIESEGSMSEEELEMTKKFASYAQSPLLSSALNLAGSLFFGFIYSLIAGLVMKSK